MATKYTNEQIAGVTDHTFLKTADELQCTESALQGKINSFFNEMEGFPHKPYAVCVRSDKVHLARILLGNSSPMNKIKIAAVVGFPDGNLYTTQQKVWETERAMDEGATEIDMVLKYDAFNAENTALASEDVNAVAQTVAKRNGLLKVILETTMINPGHVLLAGTLAINNGAHFIKTSTGYDIRTTNGMVKNKGATLDDLHVMRCSAGPQMGVKASGGVNATNVHETLDAALTFYGNSGPVLLPIDPMLVRIGASSLLKQLYSTPSQDAPKQAY